MSMNGRCNGSGIYHHKPDIHWCAASDEEAAIGRLAGARFLERFEFTPPNEWTPGQLFLRIVNNWTKRFQGPYRDQQWAVIRLNIECLYRRASVSSVSARAREKGDDERQPVVKRRLRKARTKVKK